MIQLAYREDLKYMPDSSYKAMLKNNIDVAFHKFSEKERSDFLSACIKRVNSKWAIYDESKYIKRMSTMQGSILLSMGFRQDQILIAITEIGRCTYCCINEHEFEEHIQAINKIENGNVANNK